jgi:hypothetical protein
MISAQKLTRLAVGSFLLFVSSKVQEICAMSIFKIFVGNDDHESTFDLDFLIKNQPNEFATLSETVLWNREAFEIPLKTSCRVSMRDYMSDPEVSKKVLRSLHVFGVSFIDGVQPTQQNTEFVIRNLFPVHKTLFGEMWTFSTEKDHSDTAYTNSKSNEV